MKQPRKLYLVVALPDSKETGSGKTLMFYERGFLGAENSTHLLALQRAVERYSGIPAAPRRKP